MKLESMVTFVSKDIMLIQQNETNIVIGCKKGITVVFEQSNRLYDTQFMWSGKDNIDHLVGRVCCNDRPVSYYSSELEQRIMTSICTRVYDLMDKPQGNAIKVTVCNNSGAVVAKNEKQIAASWHKSLLGVILLNHSVTAETSLFGEGINEQSTLDNFYSTIGTVCRTSDIFSDYNSEIFNSVGQEIKDVYYVLCENMLDTLLREGLEIW